MDVNEVAPVALERTHQTVPVPRFVVSMWIVVDQVFWVHQSVFQVSRIQDRVPILRVFLVALLVPSPTTGWYPWVPREPKIRAEHSSQLPNLGSTQTAGGSFL